MGYKVTVSNQPNPKADINHHVNYIAYKKCPTLNTAMVTHFTSDMYEMNEKLDKVKNLIKDGGVGICFSKGVEKYLAKEGMNPKQLKTVLPAHDSLERRPRFVMLAFKVYPDGRKREEMFAKLFRSLKNPKNFIFRIIGPGWAPILDKLSKEGIQVQWADKFDLQLYKSVLDTSDYLLYTGGEDAIAQCLVDGKNAGVRLIAPKQEHLEVEFPWETQEELNSIFAKIDENPVSDWTWERYTKDHIKIWEDLYNSLKTKRKERK